MPSDPNRFPPPRKVPVGPPKPPPPAMIPPRVESLRSLPGTPTIVEFSIASDPHVMQSRMLRDMSTRLSRRLEEIEAWLAALPMKVPVSVTFKHGTLAFDRAKEGWRLFVLEDVFENESSTPLSDSSVAVKAAAAESVGILLKQVVDQQEQMLTEVETGLAALDQLPVLVPSKLEVL